MGLLDGILGIARNAAPAVVAARGGYLQGQSDREDKDAAKKRQSILDGIKARLDEAEINERKARADSMRDPNDEQPIFDQGGGAWSYNKKRGSMRRIPTDEDAPDDGSTEPGGILGKMPAPDSGGILDRLTGKPDGGNARQQAGHPNGNSNERPANSDGPLLGRIRPTGTQGSGPKFGPRPPVPPAARRVGSEIDPTNKRYVDVYSDGTRKDVRAATAAELAKASQIPRDPSAPAPEHPVDALSKREKAAQEFAYRAVEANHGDPQAAMASMVREEDTAKTLGVKVDHYLAAAQKYQDRLTAKSKAGGSDSEAHDLLAAKDPLNHAPSGGGRSGGAKAPATGPVAPAADRQASKPAMAISASDEDVKAIIGQIKSGTVQWTAETVDAASGLTAAQKKAIKDAILRRPD